MNHMLIFSPSAYETCIYNSFCWVGMVYSVDIAAGDVININFMHLHGHERPLIGIIVVIHVMFLWKHSSKTINSYCIYWEILHLPNFSKNKLLYVVISLLPFAKCFISVNKCLVRKAKTWQYSYFRILNLHYFL